MTKEEPKIFKKKPVEICAMKWTGKNIKEIETFSKGNAFVEDDELVIKTLEDGKTGKAKHVASVGDYIIEGVQGEFYFCKPDIFDQTYEVVVEKRNADLVKNYNVSRLYLEGYDDAKEELKHEAEEKAKKRTKGFKCQENCEMSYVIGALDFAVPREKRIEELEKENADLVKDYQVSRLYLEGYEDAKKESKKEISELKDTLTKINEQNIKDCENFNKKMKEIKEQWNKEHYQLIKAKDLIAKLYHADECFTYDEEVEQFLKESE